MTLSKRFRFLKSRLPHPSSPRIVVLTGARQTGKTTLCKSTYSALRYINLDSAEERDILKQLPTLAWGQTVGNAVIDEAQKEPAIFDKVKYAFDETAVSFTVLTGSSQILLLKKIRESLAGRAFFHELWPLMQCELLLPWESGPPSPPLLDHLFSEKPVGQLLSSIPKRLLESDDYRLREAEKYMLSWGGMPALMPMAENERWEWLKNYGYTYLERDLSDLARLNDLLPFRKFQRLSALRSAGLLNYSELARDAGISVDTAKRYLEYLNISYQAILIQPYHRNLTSTMVKTPKLFWTDIGIWRQLTGYKGEITGQLYETMVVSEIFKWMRTAGKDGNLYFYRTRSGMEVDLLLETGEYLMGIEIKSRSNLGDKDTRPLRGIAEAAANRWRGGLVIYTGNEILQLPGPDIWAVPSRRLFQSI